MNTKDTPLRELIFPEGHGMPDPAWLKILSKPKLIAIFAGFAPETLDVLKTEIRNSVGALYQTSLIDVLIGGWTKYDEVSKSMEESKQKPTDTILQPLVNHTFKSVHHPYIELYSDDKPVGQIKFELTATLEVEGLKLKIQKGEVSEIMTGSCQGSIQLAFDDEVLISEPTGRIDLPGSISVTSNNDQTIVAKRKA